MKLMRLLSLLVSFSLFSCGPFLSKDALIQQRRESSDFRFFRAEPEDKHHRKISQESQDRAPQSLEKEEEVSLASHRERSKRELHQLLQSQSDFAYRHYQRYKKYFENISERIYFLSLLTLEERNQYLSSKGGAVLKGKRFELMGPLYSAGSYVFTGMTKDDVIKAWGFPNRRHTAGHERYQNERWTYAGHGEMRFVYFERGVVQGWKIGK